LELERQLSILLAAQIERDQLIAWQTDELAQKRVLLEQAEANAAEEKRRAILEQREHENRLLLLAQTSFVDMQLRSTDAKLDELLLSPGQQIGQYGAELANVRAEPEAEESELGTVGLTDADNGWADELHTVSSATLVDLNEDRDMYELKEDKQIMGAELAMESRNEG
jgi:hypothetical protein